MSVLQRHAGTLARGLLLVALAGGCRAHGPFTDADYDAAARSVDEPTLSRRIDDLASDSMLGRGPGQRGDAMTVAYLEREMRAIGLAPGGAYGYAQPVELSRLQASGTAVFRANGRSVPLDTAAMIIAGTSEGEHTLSDAAVVFVGYGVVAPEHGWDDYRGADLRGKVALILDGEPALVSRRRFGTREEKSPHAFYFLKGRQALAHGASAVVLIRNGSDTSHRARRRVLQSTVIGTAPDAIPDAAVTIHLSTSAGTALAQAAGESLAKWRALAEDSSFRPRELPLRLDAWVSAASARFTSHNVVGQLRGSDPSLRDECIVFLGHWDGYGVGPAVNGDSIYNGALDDAAGVSSMLLVAQATRTLPRPPRRTMVFVATTGEESGMRGANAYAANPVCPLKRTVFAVGMDWSWVWGVTDTIITNGFGYSNVDSVARQVAQRHRKALVPGVGEYWLASDHAVLVLNGIPAWFGGLDGDVLGKPAGWGAAQLATQQTHVPSDDRKPAWNLSGAFFEVQYIFELATRIAERDSAPMWTAPSEFREAAARRR